jgi:glycosyltransferase involved in cell wall biosynthesis
VEAETNEGREHRIVKTAEAQQLDPQGDTAPLPIAVVIAFYRSDATFPAALGSVLAQTRAPAEIVVVNDATPPESASTLERLPSSVRVLHLPRNVGVNGARRAGTAATVSPLVAYLDADDRWPAHYLAAMVEALQQSPESPGAYAGIAKVWPGGRHETFENKPPRLDIREAIVRSHVLPSAMVLRRDAVEMAGGWRDDRWVVDDWHLLVRLIDRGGPMIHVPGVVIDYTVGNAASINSRNLRVLRQWWRTLDQLGPIVERHYGAGAARRRFAKALVDRSYRVGGISGGILRLGARLLGPPLGADQPRAS